MIVRGRFLGDGRRLQRLDFGGAQLPGVKRPALQGLQPVELGRRQEDQALPPVVGDDHRFGQRPVPVDAKGPLQFGGGDGGLAHVGALWRKTWNIQILQVFRILSGRPPQKTGGLPVGRAAVAKPQGQTGMEASAAAGPGPGEGGRLSS